MRVIAGSARGRPLKAPPGRDVRPTADRVKEAVFSSLSPHLPGARVLDLYAGSGALGIEALSRGADAATFVERHARTVEVLRANLEVAGVADRATVVVGDLPGALGGLPGPFDVVVLDPPYAVADDQLDAVLAALPALLAPHAVLRLERATRSAAPRWPAGIRAGRARRYGDTTIHAATSDRGSMHGRERTSR